MYIIPTPPSARTHHSAAAYPVNPSLFLSIYLYISPLVLSRTCSQRKLFVYSFLFFLLLFCSPFVVGVRFHSLSYSRIPLSDDMAAQEPPRKSSAVLKGFPAKLKSLVHDMKGFKRDSRHQRGARSEDITRSKQPLPTEDLRPVTREDAVALETRSLFRDSPHVRSLSIRVTVKFGEPLSYAHSQDYEGSSSLQPTEELCEALIRRVDHCSKELITRRDSSALDRTGGDGLAKPLRYEILLQVLRNETGTGTEAWASRTLRSYQKQPLSTEAAREVITSTHYMVGLFLRHHDEAFVWKDGPVREDPVQEQKTFPYRPGRVQPLTSIPRSYFIEKQQDFESIPGYTVCFSFTSQNHHRKPSQWH